MDLLLFVHLVIMHIQVWTMDFVILIMLQFVLDIYKNIINFKGVYHKIFKEIEFFSKNNRISFRILIVDFDYHMGDGIKVIDLSIFKSML